MKILLFLLTGILGVQLTPLAQRYNHGNYMFVPHHNGHGRFQNYPQQNYQPQSRAPTVEIQQVTAEWVCNNYVTGEVKFFGVRDVVTTRLSSKEVEQLLKQGVPNTNLPTTNPNTNPNVNPNNPFFKPDPIPQTEPPNTDGVGIIEARIGE